jgi:hypothetical protein
MRRRLLTGVIRVDDRDRLAVEDNRKRHGRGGCAAERRTRGIGRLFADEAFDGAGGRHPRNHRVHRQRDDQLRDILRLIEADLVLTLEPVALQAEHRDA